MAGSGPSVIAMPGRGAYGRAMAAAVLRLLTLIALSFYQAPELMSRIRTAIANFKLSRASSSSAVVTEHA